MVENQQKKIFFFLPNIFTALNMGAGFLGIMLALREEFYQSCLVLILGAVFDSVDGRIARLTGTESAFGEQFDSLSDLISFGLAPALIFYLRFLHQQEELGMVVAFLYVLCGALRLARFNANIDRVSSDYFQGLPIPGAAMGLVGMVLLSIIYNHALEPFYFVAPYYIFIYSFFMISNIPFVSFKNSKWAKTHVRQALFIIFIVASALFLKLKVTLLVLINTYVIASVGYFLINRNRFRGIFDWNAQGHKDE